MVQAVLTHDNERKTTRATEVRPTYDPSPPADKGKTTAQAVGVALSASAPASGPAVYILTFASVSVRTDLI